MKFQFTALGLLAFLSSAFMSACIPEAPEPLEDPSKEKIEPRPELDRALRGYLDKSGSWAIQPQFIAGNSFSETLAHVLDPRGSYIDRKGQFVIKEPYYLAGDFHEGLAWAAVPKTKWQDVQQAEDLLYGFIDKKGEFVIKPQYPRVADFSEGLAFVQMPDTKRWGFIDKMGTVKIKDQFIVPMGFKRLPEFKYGTSYICTLDHKTFSINKRGKALSENERHELLRQTIEISNEKLAPCRKEGGESEGYINSKGNFVIPAVYIEAFPFSDGLAKVRTKESKSGFIDSSGKTAIAFTDQYEYQSFHDGLCLAKKRDGENWGYIDKSGKLAIPFKFPRAEDFSEGLAAADTLVDAKQYEQIKFPIPCSVKELLEFSNPEKD